MKLLSILAFLISTSITAMDICAPKLSSKSLSSALTHIKKINVKGNKLSGFHYYGNQGCSSIEPYETYNVCKIKPELWLVIPVEFKNSELHGGYVIFQGKNYGWKSFFPSSWNEQQLKEKIEHMLTHMKCVGQKPQMIGNLYTNEFNDGTHSFKIILYGIKDRGYVKTIYPRSTKSPNTKR